MEKRLQSVRRKKVDVFPIALNIFFVLLCACFIVPLMLVVSASFTREEWLSSGKGFALIPPDFSIEAYKSAFGDGARVARAYGVTIAQSVLGTFLQCVIAGMVGYPLSRSNFRFRKPLTVFLFITMLFSAGMIPHYIVYAKYYGISNKFWIYILPGIHGGAWNTMIYRTFFKGLPESLFESAHLDGAKELTIFFKIVVPLSKPVFASIGFMTLVGRWNNYSTSMIYIRNENLYTLQYLLQRLNNEANFLKTLAKNAAEFGNLNIDTSNMPAESLKFALCVIAAGPMLAIFPFFQKYFAKGLTIGAIKG